MDEIIEIVEFTKEEELTHYLLLNAALMPDMGILNGRMKAILHFLELSGKEDKPYYEDFAIELLDEILDTINENFPVCFGHGLCGIGWGIEYIIKKRWLAVDEDICAPYDKLVARYIRQERYDGVGVYNGLTGVLLYLLSRIENPSVTPGSSVLAENKKQIDLVINRMSRIMTVEAVLQLLKEKENSDFVMNGICFYSKWEYPVVLHTLGLVYQHGIQRSKVIMMLEHMLLPLKNDNYFPKIDVNKTLLRKILEYVFDLLPALRSKMNRMGYF